MSLGKFFYDFKCTKCGIIQEQRVHSFEINVSCVNCGQSAERLLAAPGIWWRKMGVSKDFPTAASKWDRMQEQKNRSDKGGLANGQPNLKEY